MQFNSDDMASHQPFMNFSYTPTMPSYRNQNYNQYDRSAPSTPATFASGPSSGLPQSSFRAPAGKHAHHLHSIPPREKSTRTLIIDHMLWVHGRTRFAQARAELGMTDRTGGPSSPNYVHRRRPESYEEEDEEGSEGEEVVTLKARAGDPHHPHKDEEDERLGRQDLALARNLRLRAEGLEKVVISMLEQPPLIPPINDEEILTPPTSPKLNASSLTHPHRLPNGVRLRLALGTIINDLFARQAPPPPYRHIISPNTKSAATTPPDQSPPVVPSPSDLPSALSTLAPVSGAFVPVPQTSHSVLPNRPMQGPTMQSPHYADYSPHYTQNQPYNQGSGHMRMQYHTMQQQQQHPGPPPSRPQPHASSRTRALYAVGADPDTANSPPAFRCPRHLHTGCDICVEAKSPARPTIGSSGKSSSRGRTHSFGTSDRMNGGSTNSWKAMPGGVGPGGGGITGWQDGSGIGSGLLRPGVRGSALRRKIREGDGDTATGGTGNTKLSRLIPRFIRLSALVAAELGRESRGEEEGAGAESEDGRANTSMAQSSSTGSESTPGRGEARYTPPPSTPPAVLRNPQQANAQRMYEYALRPSSEWYMLLAGLLTRAVLEGYLSAGWRGLQAVQCLLLVGLGINEDVGKEKERDRYTEEEEQDEDGEEEFSGLDPDELPNLVEAIKILFPSLREKEKERATGRASAKGKGRAEDEYEGEMLERLKRFYDIPASTPDCATHMEDLAWQYPAEPVERAAVRFCEAIAKWRGKPELETYKKKPAPTRSAMDAAADAAATGGMTIDALVHSNPVSPTMGNAHVGNGQQPLGTIGIEGLEAAAIARKRRQPSIDVYFIQAPGAGGGGGGSGVGARQEESASWTRSSGSANAGGNVNSNKRYRDTADDGGRAEKRMYA